MTPEERKETEQRADRALRRGELTEAHELLQALARAFPDDAGLRAKLGNLKESLQPAELSGARTARPAKEASTSPVDEAELLASRGDFAGAIAIYRKVIAERPDSELVKERLAELFALAQARATHRTAPAKDKALILSELLSRIDSRRRKL